MSPKVKNLSDRDGIALLSFHITNELEWIFREQPVSDVGIDGIIEIVENGSATGELIAVQVKSGESYFKSSTNEGIVFYGDIGHLNYWQSYALPILLILCRPSCGKCWWQLVDRGNVKKQDKAWKMLVPFSQEIGKETKEQIRKSVSSWRSSRLTEVIRAFLIDPSTSPLGAEGYDKLIPDWVKDMNSVSTGCLYWCLDAVGFYSNINIDWLTSNLFLGALTWCVNVLVRWKPIDLNTRLVRLALLPTAIRYSAFYVLGIAGLDYKAHEQGLGLNYAYVIRPDKRARGALCALYEYLKDVNADVQKHKQLDLNPAQAAMLAQAEFEVHRVSDSSFFNFVDYPKLNELALVGMNYFEDEKFQRYSEEKLKDLEEILKERLHPPDLIPFDEIKNMKIQSVKEWFEDADANAKQSKDCT